MTVLVCGGRDYRRQAKVAMALDAIHVDVPITLLIAGGASGVDAFAKWWALDRGVPYKEFKARWSAFGASAGPIRNELMLREGRPDLVVAFRGGRGTANMTQLAEEAGIPVDRIPE